MKSVWYRSRLSWLALIGFCTVIFAWSVPMITKESRYFSARWIAPGDFYQGFGFSHGFNGMSVWLGRPYAGFANPFRQTGVTNVTRPIDPEHNLWSLGNGSPIRIGKGQSPDSLGISFDYWFGVIVCVALFYYNMVSRRRHSKLKPD